MISMAEVHVLLIDDSDEDRAHFQDILRVYPEYKFHIYSCDNGEAGLSALRQRPYDCIVLDHNMPGSDGLQILKELRVKNIHVPVVMLTAAEDVRVAVDALRSGAQEFLPKVDANFRKLPNAILSAMERKQQELNFLQLVNNDSLTGVTSRHCFLELLDKSILRAERGNRTLALMFIDIDDFKQVNDKHGHEAGDFVLKEVAARIKSGMRSCDTLARLGGDEFVVLLEDLGDASLSGCSAVARRLINAIHAKPFQFNDKDIAVDISMGIATYPQMAHNKTELIDMADQAMYKSKRSAQNYFTFAQGMVAA